MFNSKFALGTAQFGSDYGISNISGKVEEKEVRSILELAHKFGLNTIDTAISYGDCEELLGKLTSKPWKIITKIPKLSLDNSWISQGIHREVEGSLTRLKVDKLYGVLVHDTDQLFSKRGQFIYQSLIDLKEQGYITKVGVSIYSPDQLPSLISQFPIDIVQCPMNIFDTRMQDSGWLERLSANNIEIHVRSIFLQGLLLMNASDRPTNLASYKRLWSVWDDWLLENKISSLDACLRWALNIPEINRIVIGVENCAQLERILACSSEKIPETPLWNNLFDEKLINPSKWYPN